MGKSLGFGFEEWVVGVGVESSGFAVLVVVSERASQAEVAAPPLEARATRRELPLPSQASYVSELNVVFHSLTP